MATNDERRAVAKLLRAFARDGLWSEFSDYCNCAGPGRLADLIDPDTTSDTTKSAGDTTRGPAGSDATRNYSDRTLPCDRDALLALADEMDSSRSRCDFCIKHGECDWADEAMCLESMMDDYARCIREALGVQDV